MPDGVAILTVAAKYGQSPQQVEEWEERWFNRAVLMIEGETLFLKMREVDRKKRS